MGGNARGRNPGMSPGTKPMLGMDEMKMLAGRGPADGWIENERYRTSLGRQPIRLSEYKDPTGFLPSDTRRWTR